MVFVKKSLLVRCLLLVDDLVAANDESERRLLRAEINILLDMGQLPFGGVSPSYRSRLFPKEHRYEKGSVEHALATGETWICEVCGSWNFEDEKFCCNCTAERGGVKK